MMKNKLRRDIFVIIFLLLVACIALAVPLAFSNPRWLLAPALLVVFALVVAVLGIRRLRRFVADMLCGTNFEGSKTQYSLADFSIPTALITEAPWCGIIRPSGSRSWRGRMPCWLHRTA